MALSEARRTSVGLRSVAACLALIVVLLAGIVLVVLSRTYVTTDPWQTTLNVVGGSMAVSVAASFLYKALLKPSDDAARLAELRLLLNEKMDEIVRERSRYGLDGFCGEMDFCGLFGALGNGDDLWWLDTYAPGHRLWIEHLRGAVRRGARIHMLVLDSESPCAELRAEEIGDLYAPASFRAELQAFARDIALTAETSPAGGSLEVRLYRDLPGLPAYVVCRSGKPAYAYTSFFLRRPTGVMFPHLRWRPAEAALLDHIYEYVHGKWLNAGSNAGTSGERHSRKEQAVPSPEARAAKRKRH